MAASSKQHSDSNAKIARKRASSVESALLKSAASIRDKVLFGLMVETGCTSSEVVSIQKKDINAADSSIRLGSDSRGNVRNISVSAKLLRQITKLASDKHEFLFSSREGKAITTRAVRKIFSKYSENSGTKITPSVLRKYQAQKDLGEPVAKRLGVKRFDEKSYLEKQVFKVIKGNSMGRDRLILELLFETGCTIKELVQLKVKDLDMQGLNLQVADRNVCLPKNLAIRLNRFLKAKRTDDRMFGTRQAKSMSDKRVFQIVKKCGRKSGVVVNPRMLRNSFIYNAFGQGAALEEISRQTGIKNLNKFHLYGSLRVIAK